MATQELYLLDTNVLVHFVRSSDLWNRIRVQYEPFTRDLTPLYSVVSSGELRSLAVQWNWGAHKLEQLEFGLAFIRVQTIDNNWLTCF